jgi:hypothetical protein
MNKLISTVLCATFTAVYSFGAVAGSDADKNKEMRKDSSQNMNKKEVDKAGSTVNKEGDSMREKSLSERQSELKEQEVMNKKPYKQ